MKAFVIFFLSLVATGCAVPPHMAAISSEPEGEVACHKEKPTGSNRPVVVCRPVAGILDEEQTKRDMREIQQQSELPR